MSLPQGPVNDAGIRILIVDDSRPARAMLAAVLRAAGFSFLEAGDGAEAFDLHLRHPFDLVITDLHMPNLDGIQLLAALSLTPADRRPPVIVLSGSIEDWRRSQPGELALASAVLPKPVEPRSLLLAIADALALETGPVRSPKADPP